MKKTHVTLLLISLGLCFSCSSISTQEKEIPQEKESAQQADSSFIEKKSQYAAILEKFKPISFDTLFVCYHYDPKDKTFRGEELTLKEARFLPIDLHEKAYYSKLSGAYACYQFPINASHTALIARIPGEYAATSIGLFILDREKDELWKVYFYLAASFGDAGDVYFRNSWLFKAKNNQLQSFVYDYSAQDHSVYDSDNDTIEEWESYFLINCMSPQFDTLSRNEAQLKKQFKRVLKTIE